jgi:hypothetical protein
MDLKKTMKTYKLKCVLFVIIFLGLTSSILGNEPFKCRASLNLYRDLSDTYGKGNMLSGEFSINKLWYGASLDFGYFQAQSTFIYKIIIEETNKTFEIQFDEITIMQSSAISLIVIPIQKERLQLDLAFGASLNKATSSQFNDVNYSYDLAQDEFTYLYKDYKLIKKTHFGYQVGFDLSFYIFPTIGLQLSSRIQDLNNGGTFFFVGGGLCFKL